MLYLKKNIRLANASLYALFLMSLLGGCSLFPGVYRIDIQQGNQITQEMVDQLKPGMTDKQVRFILGTPLIIDSFHPQRWDYVYRMDKPNEDTESKRLTVFFEDDLLHHFIADLSDRKASSKVVELIEEPKEERLKIPGRGRFK